MRNQDLTVKEIEGKLQYYCSYQDRCHKEVKAKLALIVDEVVDSIDVDTLNNNEKII